MPQEALALARLVILILEADVIDFAALGRPLLRGDQLFQAERLAEVGRLDLQPVIAFLAADLKSQQGGFLDRGAVIQAGEALGTATGLDGRAGRGDSGHCFHS
jgi:hypothetical protein